MTAGGSGSLVGIDPLVLASLQRAADRLEIQEVIGAYGFHYDAGDWDAFADLFTLDADYDITPDPNLLPLPQHGRQSITAEMRARREQTGPGRQPRHVVSNIVFHHLDADTAGTSSFLVVLFAFDDGRVEVRRTGVYADEFRKDGGRWRFASRHLHWTRRRLRLRAAAEARRRAIGADQPGVSGSSSSARCAANSAVQFCIPTSARPSPKTASVKLIP